MSQESFDEAFELEEKKSTRTEEPLRYKVLLINDDYTTFDFVVEVLVTIFRKNVNEAVKITNDVHHKGRGVCGIYSKEVAETKVQMVEKTSRQAGYPLRSVMEEA